MRAWKFVARTAENSSNQSAIQTLPSARMTHRTMTCSAPSAAPFLRRIRKSDDLAIAAVDVQHSILWVPVPALCPNSPCDNLRSMKTLHWILPTGLLLSAASLMLYAAKTDGMTVLTGKQAFSNTASLKPGMAHKITATDLPKPGATPSGQTPGGRGASARRTRCRRLRPDSRSDCTSVKASTIPARFARLRMAISSSPTPAPAIEPSRSSAASPPTANRSRPPMFAKLPAAFRDQLLSARPESAVGVRHQHQHARPLPL